MKRYEYAEVERATVAELDEMGADGWKPAALRFEDVSKTFHGDRLDEGWSGLLYRKVDGEDGR